MTESLIGVLWPSHGLVGLLKSPFLDEMLKTLFFMFKRSFRVFSRKYEICIFSWNHFEKSTEVDHHRLSWKQKWWLNDRVVDRGTLTIPRFCRAFEICIFGWNVEDPANGHLIGIIHHLVGNMKSAYVHEIIFKSLQNLIIIDFLGKQSGG